MNVYSEKKMLHVIDHRELQIGIENNVLERV